ARAREQGIAPEEVVTLRAPVDSDLSFDDARAWRERNYDTLRRWERPSYLLILGDLHQVPEAIHRALYDQPLGRLAFTDKTGAPELASYRLYAEKVLRWETQPAAAERACLRLLGVDDGTNATLLGKRALLAPLCELADQAGPRFPTLDRNRADQLGMQE